MVAARVELAPSFMNARTISLYERLPFDSAGASRFGFTCGVPPIFFGMMPHVSRAVYAESEQASPIFQYR